MEESNSLRIVFAGTPVFAAEHLRALIDSQHSVVGVYTQPDRPTGRGKVLAPSPVKILAFEHKIPVFQPESLKSLDEQQRLRLLNADVMVVVAYGLMLPAFILDTPAFGCLNVHASLLPRWRGAAPIQRAIEAGDKETGITIMQMDEGLDTGNMLLKASCPINDDDTAGTLHNRLLEIGPPALLKVLDLLAQGKEIAEAQDDSQSNYAKKLVKQEANLDWSSDAESLARKIRAFNPVPVCYTQLQGERFRIYSAIPIHMNCSHNKPGEVIKVSQDGILVACKKGALNILALQLPGKKLMSVKQFLNGNANLVHVGSVFISNKEH